MNLENHSIVNKPQTIAYALPVLNVMFLLGPLSVLQGIYTKYFGLSLQVIAAVMLLSKLFDAITDPIIGYYADRFYDRTGTRKPLVAVGGVLFIISSWYLYVPMEPVTTRYFIFWFLSFFVAFTLFEIPHAAWGNEISSTAHEKNTVYGWRALSINFGSLLFFAMPLLPIFDSNAFTPTTLQYSVLLAGLLMVPALLICLITVPNGLSPTKSVDCSSAKISRENTFSSLREIFTNGPLIWFLSAFLTFGLALGMWFSLIFLFIDVYLDLGEKFAIILVIGYGSGTLSLWCWTKIANRWSKKFAWGLAILLIIIGMLIVSFASPNIGNWKILVAGTMLIYIGNASITIVVPSLLADVVDFGAWKFGKNLAASYFSLYYLTMKINFALGSALGLGIAAWYGFDATAKYQTTEAIFGLSLAIAWLPAPLMLVSLGCITFIPLTCRRQNIIKKRFARRNQLEQCVNPVES